MGAGNVMRVLPNEMYAAANDFGQLSDEARHVQRRLQRSWQRLDYGGQSYARQDVDGYFRRSLNDLNRLSSILSQMQDALLMASRLIEESDQLASQNFLEKDGRNVASRHSDSEGGAKEDKSILGQIGGWIGGAGQNVGDWISSTGEDIGGWISGAAEDTWDFIVDHRDEVALGGALIAAGIVTIASGGTAAPLLVAVIGAGTAGGITLGINAASPKYDTWDGVLGNTIKGGFIGWGVGSVGAAFHTLSGITTATPWAASVGGAASQLTRSAGLALPVAKVMTFAPPILQAISGGSMIVSNEGMDWLLPEHWKATVHKVSDWVGTGASVLNLAGAVGGNALIRNAWAHPGTYPLAGSSKIFQGHHLYPQMQLGKLGFPGDLLDDAVLVPSGKLPSFIPNLHTLGPASIQNGFIPQNLTNVGGRAVFDAWAPAQQLQFLQSINKQFVSSLVMPLGQFVTDALAWAGVNSMP